MVKILHTADWHVGRTIRGLSREDEHRAVLAEIAEIAAQEEVDLVLLAGDVFDAPAPSPIAEEIVYQALLALAETAPVVLVAGNHDSPGRLEAIAPLLALGRVRVGAKISSEGILDFNALATRVALVPFITKRGIIRAEQILNLDSSELRSEYIDRVQKIVRTLCAGMTADTVNVVLGHLMVKGGVTGGSERAVHLFDYAIPTNSFPGHFNYVALGHLHRPQRIPAPQPIWYAGSPLQLDFGEEEDRKAVMIVTAEPGLPAQVESRALNAGRKLKTLRGTLESLRDADVGEAYLRIELDDPYRVGLYGEVREIFPNAVDVKLRTQSAAAGARALGRIGRPPQELFADYLEGRSIKDERLNGLFAELLAEAQEAAS